LPPDGFLLNPQEEEDVQTDGIVVEEEPDAPGKYLNSLLFFSCFVNSLMFQTWFAQIWIWTCLMFSSSILKKKTMFKPMIL
jgi:hypothetical protein